MLDTKFVQNCKIPKCKCWHDIKNVSELYLMLSQIAHAKLNWYCSKTLLIHVWTICCDCVIVLNKHVDQMLGLFLGGTDDLYDLKIWAQIYNTLASNIDVPITVCDIYKDTGKHFMIVSFCFYIFPALWNSC